MKQAFCPTMMAAITNLLLVTVFLGAIPLPAAELLPFQPPGPPRDRIAERPTFSPEDLERISRIAVQARQLKPEDRNQLKSSIQRSLTEAAEKGNLSQVRYYGELLRQIE